MSRHDRYVIECRKLDGTLDFAEPQPESFFGMFAINGISEDGMAKRIFMKYPDAVLTGDSIGLWPGVIDPRWSARRKYW